MNWCHNFYIFIDNLKKLTKNWLGFYRKKYRVNVFVVEWKWKGWVLNILRMMTIQLNDSTFMHIRYDLISGFGVIIFIILSIRTLEHDIITFITLMLSQDMWVTWNISYHQKQFTKKSLSAFDHYMKNHYEKSWKF